MSVHQIKTRTYYILKVNVVSPICVSNGENEKTDSDVLVNGNGIPFIPGTSLAGAFRNYLGSSKEEDCIFGYSQSNTGRMSSLFVSDLYFDDTSCNTGGGIVKSTRDGVKLNSEKGVDNKFDTEIVEPGISGIIRMEVVKREGDSYDYDLALAQVINGLQKGEIRIGANKNRGMGRLEITGILEKSFSKENKADWLVFCDSIGRNEIDGFTSYEDWDEGRIKTAGKFISVKKPLLLKGGISIRRYSAKPGKADYEHITSNGRPVIPGSGWNGAIRSDARRILNELGCPLERTGKLIDQWFGFVKSDSHGDSKNTETARQSMIVISESIIEGARPVPMTRSRINRFTAGTKNGALYSEISYFDGKTTLEYMIRKDEERDYKALAGLMSLIVTDIEKGYVPVGGQAGVGRGLFSADPDKESEYNEQINLDECLEQLYEIVSAKE